ncbi:unnamed protein product [Xylocopa violacea]|uniref:Structure-specific endonuclease subunit SLX4 n=1 Tax=Xylocopa violacea TaxID=135666 RepID=A0ABP1P4B7_XYLVO
MNEHIEENQNSHSTFASTENDSLLDFKSPKQLTNIKLTECSNFNVHNKKRISTKSKISGKNNKEAKKYKKHEEKMWNLQESQSIESRFFKSKSCCDDKDSAIDVKMALVCPLCFKTFKDLNSRTLHMKICAYKNNIPTKKLMDAIQLQKRQENERISLGLLAAPILQDKKKLTSLRKTDSCEETDLQLALVLSKSLQEAEELDMINEIEGLPKISNQCMQEKSESVVQLEKFGFANSKPASFTRNKKGRKNEITTLQIRSQEERNRILTERISEILVGNESITQNQKEEFKYNYVHEKKTDLKSHLLQQLCDEEQKLWNKAKLSPSQKCFYVSNLSECISSEKKEEDKRIIIEFENTNKMDNMELDKYSNENVHAISSTELCFINENCESCQDRQFINTVITNWSVILNDSSTSDIIIFVSNDKHIWAHKLVFYVQCSNILLDIKTNDSLLFTNIKEKICWIDISYNIALAFLEFIYCGIIKKYLSVVNNLTSFSLLRNLARKYKVKELFAFLQRKENEIKKAESQVLNKLEKDLFFNETDNSDLSSNDVENLVCNRNSTLEKNEKLSQKQLKEFVESKLSNDACTEVLLKEDINTLSEISDLRNSNVSPDLFDDSNDIVQSEGMIKKTACVDELIENIEHNEDVSIFDSVNKKSKFENTSCKSIDENINLSFNPLHFVTPKKGDYSNIIKLKSNLSVFIEQIQKENRISESDIECEISMLSTSPKLYRNPFHIREHNCSKVKANPIVEKTPKKDKNILNIFDGETNFETSYEGKNIDMYFNIEPVDNVVESSESSVEECKRKYKNNSVNKIITDINEGYKKKVMLCEAKNLVECITKSLSPRNKKIFDIDEELEDKTIQSDFENSLKEDFYSDEDEISIYSRYKRGHTNNSIVKYRNFVQKYLLSNDVKDNVTYQESGEVSSTEADSVAETGKNSKFKASAVKKYDDQTKIKKSISSFKKNKHFSEQSIYNHSNAPTSIQENSFERQRINNTSKLRYTKSENNIDIQAIRKNSLTLTEQNPCKQHLVESPVLLSSSPELDYDTLRTYECEENKMNKNVFLPKKFEDNISHIFEKEIYLANVQVDNINTSPFTKAESVLDEHIVFSETTNNLITTNNCLKYNEKLFITEDNEQNCQGKSISETSLSINTQCNMNNMPKVYINSQYGYSYDKDFKVTILPEIIRDSVTPPPNYDNMKTPELHAELNKYGLKIQKRKRAIKLLTYIYNELHPIICATSKNVESELAIISSEDDEPPMKKFKYKKNHADCFNNYESQLAFSQENINMQLPINIIDEEKQFNGPEFTSTIDSVLNIKDMFLKLLTVRKELHNKILAYQPVCINSLHSMLKTEGFKCKMNTLMNFLDEQCITFYVQDTKKKNDKST